MAQSYLANLSTRGVSARFAAVMDRIPTVYNKHCQVIQADTDIMPYAWPGMLPQPREFLNSRAVQGIRDFTYNVQTKEYELTIEIPRKWLEDDQTGLINARLDECAEVWATFWDFVFAALLTNGSTAGNLAYDGGVFYADTRVIGTSANIDNKLTAAAATSTTPTAAEFKAALPEIKKTLWKYQDDQGRPYNAAAIQNISFVIPPEYEYQAAEAFNATIISQTSNVFVQFAKFDVLPYLSPTAEPSKMYINALGATRKPFIDQQRTPLEIIIDSRMEDVANRNSVLVLCRQRRVLAYGDPLRSIEFTWS